MTAQAVSYSSYEEYKKYKDVELMWPLEAPEDILSAVIDAVIGHLKNYEPNDKFCNELKVMLDKDYGQYWHVFCGKSFGSYAVHDRFNFMFFKYKAYTFMIYKTTV